MNKPLKCSNKGSFVKNKLIFFIIIIICCLFSDGLSLDNQIKQNTLVTEDSILLPSINNEMNVSDITENARRSIVMIVVYDITGKVKGQGSGFFIAPRQILTNSHVVEGAYSIAIFADSNYYDYIAILKQDKDIDVALLEVEYRGESFLNLEIDQILRPGQRIIAIGYPLGLEQTISDGLISAVRATSDQYQIIQITAPISPGSSGGPLLNLYGNVIGITTATMEEGQNLNFAIGFKSINNFLSTINSPQKLHKAKSHVLFRVIFRWIVGIILALIALAFGGGWWIIIIAIFILYLIGLLFSTLYHLIVDLIRKIKDKRRSEQPKITYKFTQKDQTKSDITTNDYNNKEVVIFYCWKCGAEIKVNLLNKPDFVDCENCGITLKVPK